MQVQRDVVLAALPVLQFGPVGVVAKTAIRKSGGQAINAGHERGVGQPLVIVNKCFARRDCVSDRANDLGQVEIHERLRKPDSLVLAALLVQEEPEQCQRHDEEKEEAEVQDRSHPIGHDRQNKGDQTNDGNGDTKPVAPALFVCDPETGTRSDDDEKTEWVREPSEQD